MTNQIMYYHGSYNLRLTKFKDFSTGHFKDKSQSFQELTKINSINWNSLIPFDWLKHSMGLITLFTSSAMVDHIILY